jgi:hypothetical protein
MSVYVKCFLFLLIGLVTGYFSYPVKEPIRIDEQYGTLIVPLLDGCEHFDLNVDNVSALTLEKSKFDMTIKGANTNSYLHITHDNLPSDIMTELSVILSECMPNKQTIYDNIGMFEQDLNFYLKLSSERRVYAVFDRGEIILKYNDNHKNPK